MIISWPSDLYFCIMATCQKIFIHRSPH
uniref:Uncharacterized protein n=1 Tax=Arundo donax TaxID=35708 RepID=A0A0A9EH80_ARUDO